jgi:biopolymer transport protein ExbD
LPKANTAKSQPSAKVTVSIQPNGDLALNREPIQLDRLESRIKDLAEGDRKVVVIINADEQVGHGRVVTVMDRIREIEGASLAIATRRP